MDKGSNNFNNIIIHVPSEESLESSGPFNNNDDDISSNSQETITKGTKESDKKEVEVYQVSFHWIPAGIRKYTGLILTLIASLLLSFAVLIVKVLGTNYGYHSYTASFWRYLGVCIPSLPIVLIVERRNRASKKDSVFATIWPLHFHNIKQDSEKWWTIFGLIVRGVLGASSVILRYYALEYLSIGDASVITYATPVLVTVLAHFCLGEKSGVVPFLAAIATFCGVLVMTRPPFLTGKEEFDTQNLIGICLASGSLICSALIVIITRKIRKVDFALMTLVFGLIGVLQSVTLTQSFSVFQYPTTLIDALLIFALMSVAFCGQMAIILALTMEQAGPVSLLRSCDVIFVWLVFVTCVCNGLFAITNTNMLNFKLSFKIYKISKNQPAFKPPEIAFIFQFIFLGVIPDALSAVGGMIVVTCITVTGIRKWLSTLPEDDNQRRRFRFLLF